MSSHNAGLEMGVVGIAGTYAAYEFVPSVGSFFGDVVVDLGGLILGLMIGAAIHQSHSKGM